MPSPSGIDQLGIEVEALPWKVGKVRIAISDDTVVWNSFKQPFRRAWDYSALEPLTFGRADYEAEVARASVLFRQLLGQSAEQQRSYEIRVSALAAKYPGEAWPGWEVSARCAPR